MATNRRKSGKRGISVDFSETESSASLPEGDYLLRVDDVEQKTSENSGADYLAITFVVDEGEFKGKKVWHNCSLQPQALFNLRAVLESLGFEVPQGVMDLDPADMVGECCGAAIVLEVFEGKSKPRVAEFFPAEELDEVAEEAGEEAEEEEETKPTKKSPKAKPVTKKKPSIEVGSKVSFVDDEGDDQSGKVLSIEDGVATVKVGKEEWEIDVEDLTLE